MPLMSCWTKTSMRPPCSDRSSPLVPAPAAPFSPNGSLNQSLNRGALGRQRREAAQVHWPNRHALLSNGGMEPNGELYLRMAAALGIFAAMALWEFIAPRRALSVGRLRRWPGNLAILVLDALLVRFLIPVAAAGTAAIAAQRGWGFLNITPWPAWLEILLGLVALDLPRYAQHVVFHKVPWLWRLHRMHHADLDIDVSTGLRFHPIEIILSMLIKVAVVVLVGAPVVAVIAFEVVLNATS